MKYIFTCLTALVFIFCSCKFKDTPSQPQQNVPAALQEKSVSAEIFTKRAPQDDIVGDLYRDIADTTPVLRDFEKMCNLLAEKKTDTIAVYQTYNENNKDYYASANQYIRTMSDSSLKEKIRLLINKSSAAYTARTASYEQLIAAVDAKSANLNDLRLVLKLVTTIPVMEKYQKENLPSVAAIKKVEMEHVNAARRADSLLKK